MRVRIKRKIEENMDKSKLEELVSVSPLLSRFRSSGDSHRVSRLLSMAYLVNSVGNAYFEEANDILCSYGLVHKKLKTRSVNLSSAFDLYDREVFRLVNDESSRRQLCSDYDVFRRKCDRFMNMDDVVMSSDSTRATDGYICLVSDGTKSDYMLLYWDSSDRMWRYVHVDGGMWVRRGIPSGWSVTSVLRRLSD